MPDTAILMDDDPSVVCRVTPEGDVVCEPVNVGQPTMTDPDSQKQIEATLRQAFPKGEWGPNKLKLALALLETLAESTLPDEPHIPRRAGEIVESTKMLLAKTPPSILLYNYSSQPADVIGAYFLNKTELVRMQRLYDTFRDPKPA
ncbi:MAG: hypothetical protein IT354_11375 [Gemmatimonadaceae bacterium]|jgi:hypothetical protein|nr:hypothetical protein [Gemmatimonadaceae bacterium]